MVRLREEEIFNKISCRTVDLQKNTIKRICLIFYENEIANLKIICTEGLGVRGEYEDLVNNQIDLSFEYFTYKFDFYLSYDQLEYFISKNNQILKECNLEDFWETKIHTRKFIDYLKKDLSNLNIIFNI